MVKKLLLSIFSLSIILSCAIFLQSSCTNSKQVDVLSTLEKAHPRLILNNEGLAERKRLMEKDENLKKYFQDVLKEADEYCNKPKLTYDPKSRQNLGISRECMDRIYALGLAWRITGKEIYAEKAKENLLTVCSFRAWSPSFLAVAEMCHAVGVGYDWFFDYLTPDDRNTIKTALINKGLIPGIEAYSTGTWAVNNEWNWNFVCNGGLIIGALAIADIEPDLARYIVSNAVKRIPISLETYKPDGVWPESISYWRYGMTYFMYSILAMESALNTDFGLTESEGLPEAGLFPIYGAGPTGYSISYADIGQNSRRGNIPPLFWLARRYNKPLLADEEHRMTVKHGARSMDFILYIPPVGKKLSSLPLDKLFRGKVGIAIFRSSWDDPNALFVSVKAGNNQSDHGNLDLGTFEVHALGERWARDLGSEDYWLPGYWDLGKGGQRWTYYRTRSVSHNVPLIDGQNQDELAQTYITRFNAEPPTGFAILDLTPAYKEFAQKVVRGVAVIQDKRGVIVQDEFELNTARDIAWGMTTDAEISIEKGNAVLKKKW
ncbi:heparinase II/III family protein [candidate division KSB1 bacterium]